MNLIAKKRHFTRKSLFYNFDGELFKKIILGQYEEIDTGTFIVRRMEALNLENNRKSILTIDKLQKGTALTENSYTPAALENNRNAYLKTIMKNTFLIFLILSSLVLSSQSLTIEFESIRNDQGLLYVTVYPSEDIWLDDIYELEHIFPKENIVDGKMSVTIDDMQPGKYGVAMLDDENKDGDMKYNFIGMPREGYGFSRNYKVRLSKPKFEDCVLEFKNDTTIRIVVQYM